MEKQLNAKYSAIIDADGNVYGVGQSERAAWRDAAKWTDDVDGIECVFCTAAALIEIRRNGFDYTRANTYYGFGTGIKRVVMTARQIERADAGELTF